MIEKTLAKRYAGALLAGAIQENKVEEIEGQLLALKEAYRRDARFRAALAQPRLSPAIRRGLLRKPFEGRSAPIFLHFLDLLVDKRRINLLPDIADMFDRLADASQGVVQVDVRSAFPLTDAQRRSLEERLARVTGARVRLEETVDRTLRAGMSVRIGDRVVDGTVAHRVKRLREHLTELHRT